MKNMKFSILLFSLIVLSMIASIGIDLIQGRSDKGEAKAGGSEEIQLLADIEGLLAKSVTRYQSFLEEERMSRICADIFQQIKEAHKGDLLLVEDIMGSRASLNADAPPSGIEGSIRVTLIRAIAMEEDISAHCMELMEKADISNAGSKNTIGLARVINGNSTWALRSLRDMEASGQ